MYKCLECGNEDKFYGIVKEQGNALIFQNPKKSGERNGSAVKELAHAVNEGGSFSSGPAEDRFDSNTVRGNLWAIQNNGNSDEITWAYITSEGCWKGFHEVRSCALCNSRNIASL
ncbi:MAG: hypothetical protein K8S14_06290 [Actinomycetia bacterium]|nr:hypothetical protein [Actinomycetes bacterium]